MPPDSPPPLTKEDIEAKSLLDKRERWFAKLQRTFDLMGKLPDREATFLARTKTLEAELEKFNDVQERLAKLKITLGLDIPIDQCSQAYEELYY